MDPKNMRQFCSRAAILIGTLFLISACYRVVNTQMAPTNTHESPTEELDEVIEPLTEEKLKNASYQLEEIGQVQLIDGGYENQYGDSAAMVDRAGLLGAALGQLNDDDLNDAAVILWHNSGGSGTFIYLIALYNDVGEPRQVASKLLGDRVQVESLTIQSRQIVLQAITHGPDDPLCCPSQQVTWIYAFENDRLTQIHEIFASTSTPGNTPEPEPTPIPAKTPTPEPTTAVEKGVDTLDGTQWALVSYRNQNGELVDVPDGVSATAAFEAGQVNGKAGCNSYFGSYRAGDGRVEFGVLGQTEMYCMEPEGVMELEMAFLQALSQAASYTIQDDVLTFTDDGGSAAAVFG
ncbi:MAG: META domain-containing protein, partial [Anaerolineales bacterium]|nr:META domain-containing protein [Anaerolineales bacterium]